MPDSRGPAVLFRRHSPADSGACYALLTFAIICARLALARRPAVLNTPLLRPLYAKHET